jgi:hypothetical protein
MHRHAPHLLSRPLLGLAVGVAASITQAVAAVGTLVALGTTGNETILVRKASDPPVSVINIVPTGAAQFAPSVFDDCVVTSNGGAKACADASAAWIDLGGGNVASGFGMDGTLTVSKLAIGDRAFARQTRLLTLSITGATVSEPYVIELSGTRTSSLPIADAALACMVRNQSGVILYAGLPNGFATSLGLTDGTYTIELTATAELEAIDLPNAATMDYAFTITSPEITCGSSFAGSCYVPHQGTSCNDAACCETICAIDPTCCSSAWDQECVAHATVGCTTPTEITERFVDPLTGKRYAILGEGIWLSALQAVQPLGGTLATIENRAKAAWIQRSVSLTAPTFGVGSLWIGLTDANHAGASEGAFRWTSGASLGFAAWAPGQPNASDPTDDYVALRVSDGAWSDRTGFEVERGLAEFAVPHCGEGGSCTAVHGPGCDDGTCCESVCALDEYCCTTAWDASCVQKAILLCDGSVLAGPFIHHHTRRRYYISALSSATIAERAAIALGGTLAVPRDADENRWILGNLANGALGPVNGWLGVHDQLVEGQYQTHLGLPSTYLGWDLQQPDNLNDSDFVQMTPTPFPGMGGWHDTPHTAAAYGFIELGCEGDLSEDGQVGAADISILLGAWGGAEGDLNGDGQTGAADLSILLGRWGPCPTTSCCSTHGSGGCDLPGCEGCVCLIDPTCCTTAWDAGCVAIGSTSCFDLCQCDPLP